MIDHHMPSMKKTENAFIDYSYQSCSTIVWELLKEEGYDVKANEKLSIAFLYGLYTDTSSYVDLYKKHDIAMRDELSKDYPELERLKKSSMSLEDLMIAGAVSYTHLVTTSNTAAVKAAKEIRIVPLSEVKTENEERVTTEIKELDRVLGGGIVPGSLILVGGDPGIGKSTLLLQVCQKLAKKERKVLYISGEESLRQIKRCV